MNFDWRLVAYDKLNARQKEQHNFQCLSAILANYGYMTVKLSDDWNGADFLAYHYDDPKTIHRIQLKGRLTFDEKYIDKGLNIAFRADGEWYLVPHDNALKLLKEHPFLKSISWTEKKGYSFPKLAKDLKKKLLIYRIPISRN